MRRTIGRIAHLEMHWSDIVRVRSWLRHQLIGCVLEDLSSVEQCQDGIVIATITIVDGSSHCNVIIHEKVQPDCVVIPCLVRVEVDFKVHGITCFDGPFVNNCFLVVPDSDLLLVDIVEVLGDLLAVELVDFSLQAL